MWTKQKVIPSGTMSPIAGACAVGFLLGVVSIAISWVLDLIF